MHQTRNWVSVSSLFVYSIKSPLLPLIKKKIKPYKPRLLLLLQSQLLFRVTAHRTMTENFSIFILLYHTESSPGAMWHSLEIYILYTQTSRGFEDTPNRAYWPSFCKTVQNTHKFIPNIEDQVILKQHFILNVFKI